MIYQPVGFWQKADNYLMELLYTEILSSLPELDYLITSIVEYNRERK